MFLFYFLNVFIYFICLEKRVLSDKTTTSNSVKRKLFDVSSSEGKLLVLLKTKLETSKICFNYKIIS